MEIGLEITSVDAADAIISIAKSCSFDFGVSQMLKLNSNLLTGKVPAALTESALVIKNSGKEFDNVEIAQFLKSGEVCQWTELESQEETIRINSELLFRKQIDWASHIGLDSVLFPLPPPSMLFNFSRLVQNSFEKLNYNTMCSQFVVSFDSFGDREKNGLSYYQEYLAHLYDNQPDESIIDKFATGYQDYLQIPLQPLMDNLQSQTYQVFESDPVKYDQYEIAMTRALRDRPSADQVVVIMVVGAGRGPLVDRALKASAAANREVKVYAIEKNSNAIVNLHARREKEWGNSVQVVHCDMRFWNFPEKCDILVSELLGSMGDNELSPECLDGIQHVLKPNGISIPASYKSYIAPISSTSLFAKTQSSEGSKHSQIPYVVKFRDVFEIANPLEIWEFHHPNNCKKMNPLGHPDFNCHNTRFAVKSFNIQNDCLLHGFAAYFESVLYKDTILSILPATHSPNMTSWFPMFFPSKVSPQKLTQRPIYLKKNIELKITLWRLTNPRKVWYEWSFEVDDESIGISNVNGSCFWIGL